MEEITVIQSLADHYKSNPLIRGLIQLVPCGIGSAIDVAFMIKIENMQRERFWVFFDELAKGSRDLTESMVQEEDFLHAYFCTLKAAINTRRKEKIRLFARLLLSATIEKSLSDDTYEEFLDILDGISFRELHILLLLKYYEDSHPREIIENGVMENDMQRANRYWDSFEKEVEYKLGLNTEELKSALNRLRRTGFFDFLTGFLDMSGKEGKLSPVFTQFTKWIQVNAKDITDLSS